MRWLEEQAISTDVLVIGGGVAGLRCALEAGKAGLRVLLVSRTRLDDSGTSNADVAEMAGFNAPEEESDVESYYEDMRKAGQGIDDPHLTSLIATEAHEILEEMKGWGVPFEKNPDGSLYTYRGCFSSFPRTHVVKGHGRGMTKVLRKQLCQCPTVSFLEGVAVSLITSNGRCVGVHVIGPQKENIAIWAGAVVFATGGSGKAFSRHFSPADITGAGYVLAYEAGAKLVNLEFMQVGLGFSYPVINIFNGYIWQGIPLLTDRDGNNIFGKGVLENPSYEKILYDHIWHYPFSSSDESKWLEIRINQVATSSQGTDHHGVLCDLTHMTDAYVKALDDRSGIHHMWPLAYEFMKERGCDLLRQPVEIACFQHAMNGGIRIDEWGRTSLPGLFAVGECAGGPHGADRLGGNMFVTSLVMGRRVGHYLATHPMKRDKGAEDASSRERYEKAVSLVFAEKDGMKETIARLQELNQKCLLVNRSQAGLQKLLAFDEALVPQLEDRPVQDASLLDFSAFDLWCMTLSTQLIAKSALERRESRGSHFREDYPTKDPAFGFVLERQKDGVQ